MHRWYLIPLVCALSAAPGHAATYTVSPGQSISAALSQMHAGDTLTLTAGTYDAANLHPPSGVTIQGTAGQSVTLRPSGSADNVFGFAGSQVTIKNLTIDGSARVKVGIEIDGTDSTLQDVTITNTTSQGVALFCASGNHPGCGHGGNTLINVHASEAGMGGCHAGGVVEDGLCHGVYIYSDDNRIIGGEYDHNNGFGIQTYGSHTTIQNVSLHDNVAGGTTLNGSASLDNVVVSHNGSAGQAAAGWVIGPGSSVRNVTITDNGTVGIAVKSSACGATFTNIKASGNHPDAMNDCGGSLSVSGSGASLVPGQSTVSASLPPAPVSLPVPKGLRAISLP